MPELNKILNEFKEYRLIKGIVKYFQTIKPTPKTRFRGWTLIIIIVVSCALYAYNHRKEKFNKWGVVLRIEKRIQRNKNIEHIPIIIQAQHSKDSLDEIKDGYLLEFVKHSLNEHKTQGEFNVELSKNVSNLSKQMDKVIKRTYTTDEYIKYLESKKEVSYHSIRDTNNFEF